MQERGKLKTRIFKLADLAGLTLADLAEAMGVDVSTVYRVKMGQRNIGDAFITGAKRAFPTMDLDDLFYVEEPKSEDAPAAS